MQQEKKQYLSSYIYQEAKINRLKQMVLLNPSQEEKYLSKIEECKRKRNDIEEKITQIDNELLSELLFQKYIFGKTLEEISFILNYSKRHIERLHIKALEEFKM